MRRQVDAWRRSSQARGVHPWFAPLLYASLSGPIRSTVPSTLPGPRSPPSAPRSPVSPSLFFSTTGGARHLSTVAVGCLFGLRTSSPTAVVLMALFSSAYAGDFGSDDEVLALAALGAPGAKLPKARCCWRRSAGKARVSAASTSGSGQQGRAADERSEWDVAGADPPGAGKARVLAAS